MAIPDTSKSDSSVQTKAEEAIIRALENQIRQGADPGTHLILHPNPIDMGGKVHIEVDAMSEDRQFVVEAYARQGQLKGAQLKKIAQDILKLALLKKNPEWVNAKTIIVFASNEARTSVSGWVRLAAEQFGVAFEVVDIDGDLRAAILAVQSRQRMVNTVDSADDLVPEGIDPAVTSEGSSSKT